MVNSITTKATGAALALDFASICAYKGAIVCEPFGDFAPYDILLDVPQIGFFRVQVKTASTTKTGSLSFNAQPRVPCVGGNGKLSSKVQPYSADTVDALVSKIGNDWFILDNVHQLPATVSINPAKPGKYAAAQNAWARIGL